MSMANRKCPKCASASLTMQLKPDGDAKCLVCKYEGKTNEFLGIEVDSHIQIKPFELPKMNLQEKPFYSLMDSDAIKCRLSFTAPCDGTYSFGKHEAKLKAGQHYNIETTQGELARHVLKFIKDKDVEHGK